MAQILKDELRQAILEAAKQEFLDKGYKGASMRSIAKKANMTVGNLYRYFKNKEEINLTIVGPTFKEIDQALKAITANNVSMEARVFNLKPNIDELKTMLDKLMDKLVDIYSLHKKEFSILMLHSRLNEEMTIWFTEIVNSIISENFILNGLKLDQNALAKAYAESIFSGIRSIFEESKKENEELKILLKAYLRSFVFMLDSDLKRITG